MEYQHPSFQFQQFSFQSSSRQALQSPSYDHIQHISPDSTASDLSETSLLDVHLLSQQFSLHTIRHEDNYTYRSSSSSSVSSTPSPTQSSASSPRMSISSPQQHHYRSHHSGNNHDIAAIRAQRQASTRLQTTQTHQRALALLVARMVDSHEQCSMTTSTTSSRPQLQQRSLSTDGVTPSTPEPVGAAQMRYRRSSERSGAAVHQWMSKSIRVRKSQGQSRKRSAEVGR